jgi:hypothetical protein
MSALRFPGIKLEAGETRISLEEFRRQQAEPVPKTVEKKKGGRFSKFNAIAVETEYGRFDSKLEYQRFLELQLMERAGLISDLRRQIKYPLVLGDTLVCTYIADFVYLKNGTEVVEDSKGFRTREYLMKKNLMKKIHNIEIFETGPKKNKKSARRGS